MDPKFSPPMPRPTERALRPTSASAKLQSHPSFYTPLTDSGKRRTLSAYQSLGGRSRRSLVAADARIEEEEDFKSDAQLRRSTITGAEQFSGKDSKMVQPTGEQSTGEESFKTKVEEYVTIDILRKLLMAFLKNRQSRYDEGRMSKEEFRDILKEHLANAGIKAQHVVAFFEKIDWPNHGTIGWSDFCTYMQLQYSQREELYVKERAVHLILPAKSLIAPHRDDVIKLIDAGDNTLVSCGKDGYVCFWTANTLELRRQKDLIASSSSVAFKKNRARAKWSTDACVLAEFNKLCIATGDREFLFYELSSLSSYCQVAKLPGIPIAMCYSSRRQPGARKEINTVDEGIFVFGDTNGQVHVISLMNPGEFLRTWKKAKPAEAGGMPTTSFEEVIASPNCRYVCWAVHNDWAHTVFHWQELDQIVSASNDSNNSFVIGCVFPLTNVDTLRDTGTNRKSQFLTTSQSIHPIQRPSDQQTVFRVHKGVKALTVSRRFNCLISGGMDRVIRIWTPFSPNAPTAMLRGHAAPIMSIYTDDSEARIFSFSQDKAVRVWNLLDHTCLLSVKTKSHKIVGDLQVAFYSPSSKVISMATDRMSIIPVFTRAAVHLEVVSTHREPVTCCLYNPVFNHVVSCSEGSVIRIWDLDTGGLVFEYGEAHGESGITSANFDITWRRLVTGGRDGVVHIWNYNNGHRLKTLLPAKQSHRSGPLHKFSVTSSMGFGPITTSSGGKVNSEICGVTYAELNKNRYVITNGWDRKINIYLDNPGLDAQSEVQTPSFRWDDDVDHGHRDDILCSAQCPPNWLATGGFDGQLIIWNMVSGHQLANLDSPDASLVKLANPAVVNQEEQQRSEDSQERILDNKYDHSARSGTRSARRQYSPSPDDIKQKVHVDTAIRKIIFLPRRAIQRNAEGAQLIAAGPHGCLHFWNVYHGGKLLARVAGSALNEGVATAVALDDKEECLFTGDSYGFVYKWYIAEYATGLDFMLRPPELRCFFRCHVDAISSIVHIAKHQVLLTSSLDCCVRMWDLTGGYIGTFGQTDLWDIRNPATYRRPHVPYDVLIDPLSVPGPSGVIDGTIPDPKDRVTLAEVLAEMKAEQRQTKSSDSDMSDIWSNRTSRKLSTDQQIEEEIKTRAYSAGTGKRLRHERQKISAREWLGPSHYQTLKCHDLDDGPSKTAQIAEATKKEIARQVPRTSFDDLNI